MTDTSLAELEVLAGNRQRALSLLESASEKGEPFLVDIATNPAFDELRADPRFESVLSSLGLAGDPALRY